jgi:hypothetical protein
MIYEYNLTIPANTPASDPAYLEMPLGPGIIHKLEVEFPLGCNKAVLVALLRGLHQIWPTNPDGALSANAYTISYPEYQPLEEAPFQVEAYGWSPGTAYSHTITIRIGVLPREVLEPGREALHFMGRLKNLIFGRA